MATDWSEFDKSIPPWLIRDAFAILSTLIDFDHIQDEHGEIHPTRGSCQRRRWKRMVDYFINTPVITSKGERFLVMAGVPSGSCFTNLIDSIINCIVTRYLLFETTGNFPIEEVFLGDDGIYVSSVPVNLDDIARLAVETFGMILSPTKSVVTRNPDNVYFLGFFNKAGQPFKPGDGLIGGFLYPERTRRTPLEGASTALGQLYTCFDPAQAYKWWQVITIYIDSYGLTTQEVVYELKNHYHRHKYLKTLGVEVDSVTLPDPGDSRLIIEARPKSTPLRYLKRKKVDFAELWVRTCVWLDTFVE